MVSFKVCVDETKDSAGRHVAAIIIRSMEESSRPYLIHVVELDATNGETIRTAVDDGLKKLGEDCNREDVLVLLTDKAPYMKRAGENFFI